MCADQSQIDSKSVKKKYEWQKFSWDRAKLKEEAKETKKGKELEMEEVVLTLAQCDSSRSLSLGQEKKSERLSFW